MFLVTENMDDGRVRKHNWTDDDFRIYLDCFGRDGEPLSKYQTKNVSHTFTVSDAIVEVNWQR